MDNSIPTRSSSSTSSSDVLAKPIEYQLATLNAGALVADDDSTVIRFRYLLGNISKITGATPTHIADVAVSSRQRLHDDYGKDVSLLSVVEDLNTLSESDRSGDSIDAIAAMMVVLGGK